MEKKIDLCDDREVDQSDSSSDIDDMTDDVSIVVVDFSLYNVNLI